MNLMVYMPFKSPSDATIYVRALQQKRIENSVGGPELNVENWINPNVNEEDLNSKVSKSLSEHNKSNSDRSNHIDAILDKLRKTAVGTKGVDRGPSTSARQPHEVQEEVDIRAREQELAQQAIINAEKFKADVNTAGMANQSFTVPPVDLNFDDNKDEEFSEGTCHVDASTTLKICKGQFIEVAKIIPKQQAINNDDNKRLELVNKDGFTYYIPSANEQKEVKINNVRKWEQGFKVYAAIYSKANPHRAAEIWQYIHTINLAASSYHWDNVAYYDFMFRQQMAKYPQRSWRKINHQLWSLAMRDPISSKNQNHFQSNNGNNNNNRKSGDFKDNCCWRYNRNKCNRSSANCRFEHRCSFCGSYNHILLNCFKKKREGSNNNSASNSHNKNENSNTTGNRSAKDNEK